MLILGILIIGTALFGFLFPRILWRISKMPYDREEMYNEWWLVQLRIFSGMSLAIGVFLVVEGLNQSAWGFLGILLVIFCALLFLFNQRIWKITTTMEERIVSEICRKCNNSYEEWAIFTKIYALTGLVAGILLLLKKIKIL